MFILNCACGNEIFGDEEDGAAAWQCEQCGRWYDYFGYEIDKAKHDEMLKKQIAQIYGEDES